MSKSDEIEVLSESTSGIHHIRFTSGEFEGIVFTLGQVTFKEDDERDECVMSYDYDIISNPLETFDEDDFKQYVGDLLIEMIQDQLEKNDLVYTGGVDENRTIDTEQSDI